MNCSCSFICRFDYLLVVRASVLCWNSRRYCVNRVSCFVFQKSWKKKQWEQSDKSKQIAEKVLRKHLNVFNIVWLLTHFRLKSGLKIFAICLSICDIQIQTQCTCFPNLNCVQVLIRLKSIYFRSTLKSKFVLCHELKNGQPQKGKAKKKNVFGLTSGDIFVSIANGIRVRQWILSIRVFTNGKTRRIFSQKELCPRFMHWFWQHLIWLHKNKLFTFYRYPAFGINEAQKFNYRVNSMNKNKTDKRREE